MYLPSFSGGCFCGPELTACFQQMERERLAREKEEKEKAEKAQKLKESFGDATSQWEEDKSKLQQVAIAESQKKQEDAQKAAAAGSKTGEKAEAR